MGIFTANSNNYNIATEGEVSNILSHFNSDYIFDIVRENINNRFGVFQLSMPNIPASFEATLKQTKLQYPDNAQQIEDVRNDTYMQILQLISTNCNVSINYDQITDPYSAAFYLYDFFVSSFTNNISTFFINYIVKEKNMIYDALNLAEYKKNKDSSTLYAKKLYKNTKLAIISANIDYVINNICVFDIPFYTILSTIYQDKNIIKYLSDICAPVYDFFKYTYVPLIQGPSRPILLTNIRLGIQQLAISEDIDISNIIK